MRSPNVSSPRTSGNMVLHLLSRQMNLLTTQTNDVRSAFPEDKRAARCRAPVSAAEDAFAAGRGTADTVGGGLELGARGGSQCDPDGGLTTMERLRRCSSRRPLSRPSCSGSEWG